LTARSKAAAYASAEQAGRPFRFLPIEKGAWRGTGILPLSFFSDFGDRRDACPTLATAFFAMRKVFRRKIGGINPRSLCFGATSRQSKG